MLWYSTVGMVATIVDFGLLYLFVDILHIHYTLGVMAAYFFAALVNYLLQKKWTFKCKSTKYCKQFIAFFIIGLGGMAINIAIIVIFVEYLSLSYLLGKGVATIVAYFWNFHLNQHGTFKHLV